MDAFVLVSGASDFSLAVGDAASTGGGRSRRLDIQPAGPELSASRGWSTTLWTRVPRSLPIMRVAAMEINWVRGSGRGTVAL